MAERDQQRSRIITILILAQVMLTIAVALGNVGQPGSVPGLAIAAAAVIIYLAALIANRAFHRISTAAYMLIGGGALTTAASALIPALAGDPRQVGQASLLFTVVILEAGLLFAQEVTLITATATSAFTAFSLLLSIAFATQIARQEAYLLIVTTLGIEALAALVAWLVSNFIFEATFEAQRTEDLQFAQARLDALQANSYDNERDVDQSVRAIQQTITRVIGGEYGIRAELAEGPLRPLEDSLNLLLERVQYANEADQMRARLEAAALPLVDALSRMSDTGTLTPSSLPIMTNTPLDSVAVALSQMQTHIMQRTTRIQRLASDLVGAISHSQEGLNGVDEAIQESGRITGALVASVQTVQDTLRGELELLVRLQRAISELMPPETRRAVGSISPTEAAVWLGLGPDIGIRDGLTDEFEVVASGEPLDASDVGSFTKPLAAIDAAAMQREMEAAGTTENLSVPADTEGEASSISLSAAEALWRLVEALAGDIKEIDGAMGQIARDLGIQTRHLRKADGDIAWFQQAVKAMRSNSEQLQQIAGANFPPPGPGEPAPAASSRPLEMPLRAPQRTRPLASEFEKLTPGILDALDKPAPGQEEPPAPGTLRASDLISQDGEDSPFLGLD